MTVRICRSLRNVVNNLWLVCCRPAPGGLRSAGCSTAPIATLGGESGPWEITVTNQLGQVGNSAIQCMMLRGDYSLVCVSFSFTQRYIIIVIMPMVLLIAFIDVYLCKLMHFYASLHSFLLFSFILFIARYYMKVYAYHVKVCYPCVLDIP